MCRVNACINEADYHTGSGHVTVRRVSNFVPYHWCAYVGYVHVISVNAEGVRILNPRNER